MTEIEKHGEKSSFCEPGDNVKIKVGGIQDEWEMIESGFMLCPVKYPIPHSTTIDAEVSLTENPKRTSSSRPVASVDTRQCACTAQAFDASGVLTFS